MCTQTLLPPRGAGCLLGRDSLLRATLFTQTTPWLHHGLLCLRLSLQAPAPMPAYAQCSQLTTLTSLKASR